MYAATHDKHVSSTTLGAQTLAEGDRLHGMDAFRASMMLLGILLHINWFFQPTYFGHPITDAAASWGHTHAFYWIHTFRMQAFFLVAGFFACLLLTKRGVWGFTRNRLVRIGATFALFLPILYPITQIQYQWGGRLSGRIQSDLSAWQSVVEEFQALPVSQINVLHLWFLETLLLLYASSLALWALCRYALDRRGRLRQMAQRAVGKALSIPGGELLFAIPVAAALYAADTWLGIDSGYTLKPVWTGVFAYWVFFAVGWCLHQQAGLLGTFTRGWQFKLLLGTLLSVALCGYYWSRARNEGIHFLYPMIGDAELRDYPGLRRKLLDSQARQTEPLLAAVWENISAPHQRSLERHEQMTADQLAGLGMELSLNVVVNPKFHESRALTGNLAGAREYPALATAANATDPEQASQLRRQVLEATLAPHILPRPTQPRWLRAGYFLGYAITSWLLTSGTLGMFLWMFPHPSTTWRYLADASYWMYLVHIPVLFQIQLWIAPIALPWPVKYVMYALPAFAVMLPTYHLLVRPTPLGWLLNGRRYSVIYTRKVQPTLSPHLVARDDPAEIRNATASSSVPG